MRNSFRFGIGIRFILTIALCLPFGTYFAESGDGKYVISASDEAYPNPEAIPSVESDTRKLAAISIFEEASLDFAVVPSGESDDKEYVFVLACNEPYVIPTAIAIYSLKETNRYIKKILILTYEVTPESMQKLIAMGDELTIIYVVDLRDA